VRFASVKGEAEFFAVDTANPSAPVHLWSRETEGFVSFAPTLDAFLARLLAKDDKTLLQRIRAALKPAMAATTKTKREQALTTLDTLAMELEGFEDVGEHDDVAEFHNARGVVLQRHGSHAEARKSFQRARQHGSDVGLLNLISSHLDAKDFEQVIELGEHAAVVADEHAQWLSRYMAEAYLQLGRANPAVVEVRGLLKGKRAAETRRWLVALARGNDTAREVLAKIDELLAIGEGRSACERFSRGQGTIAFALGDGRVVQVTAYLAKGEDEAGIRRGDRLRVVGARKVGSTKSPVVVTSTK
jgi:tetratricopeptide (TPR) repeat protein